MKSEVMQLTHDIVDALSSHMTSRTMKNYQTDFPIIRAVLIILESPFLIDHDAQMICKAIAG